MLMTFVLLMVSYFISFSSLKLKEPWIIFCLVDSHANDIVAATANHRRRYCHCYIHQVLCRQRRSWEGAGEQALYSVPKRGSCHNIGNIKLLHQCHIAIDSDANSVLHRFIFVEIWNATGTSVSNDSLWYSSTRTTFLLSCGSHSEGNCHGCYLVVSTSKLFSPDFNITTTCTCLYISNLLL